MPLYCNRIDVLLLDGFSSSITLQLPGIDIKIKEFNHSLYSLGCQDWGKETGHCIDSNVMTVGNVIKTYQFMH